MISESLLLLECYHKVICDNTMNIWFCTCPKCNKLQSVIMQINLYDNGGVFITK